MNSDQQKFVLPLPPQGSDPPTMPPARSAPGARGFFLDVFQQVGQPVLGALIILETGGEGVILQLVGETLTQRLAGAGVVRQAQVASHLRKYFFKYSIIFEAA